MSVIKLTSSIENDKYTEYVYDAFDIQNRDETEVEVSFNLSEAKNFDWNDKPIGINAVIPQPSGHFKNGVRESRIVVLPDYQGLGLGTTISNFTASIYKDNGYRYFTKTVHPAIGEYRNKNNELWRGTSKNGKLPKSQNAMGGMTGWNVLIRTSYCHEYIGEGLSGYEELLKPIKEMRV